MAGDENEAGHGASEHSGAPVDPKAAHPETTHPETKGPAIVEPSPGEAKSAASAGGLASEWTASDTRGPLNAVGAVPRAGGEPHAGGEGFAATGFDQDSAVEPPIAPAPPTRDTAARDTAPGTPTGAPPRKASVVPIAAGIVVGAMIGAGSAYYVYTTMGIGAAAEKTIAATEQKQAANDQKLATLGARVEELAKRPDVAQAVDPVKASVADLAKKVAAVEQRAAEPKASQPAQGAATPGGSDAPRADVSKTVASIESTLAALKQKIDGLEAALGSVKQQTASASDLTATETKVAAVAASVADLRKQATGAQSDVQALRAGQSSLEGKITSAPGLAVVADSLVQRIDRGLPFAAQVDALASLGTDPTKIAILRQYADKGVPSAKVLADKFEPLVDGLLSSARKVPANAGFWDRMKDGMGGLVSVHRVDDVTGDDPSSHVSRIRADLAHDDVIDAVATWTKLPPEARAKPEAEAWGALAKTHADALAAAQAIASDAIASLGAKKS